MAAIRCNTLASGWLQNCERKLTSSYKVAYLVYIIIVRQTQHSRRVESINVRAKTAPQVATASAQWHMLPLCVCAAVNVSAWAEKSKDSWLVALENQISGSKEVLVRTQMSSWIHVISQDIFHYSSIGVITTKTCGPSKPEIHICPNCPVIENVFLPRKHTHFTAIDTIMVSTENTESRWCDAQWISLLSLFPIMCMGVLPECICTKCM